MCCIISICIVSSQELQYIPRNRHTVFALLCFVVVIHWLIFPYPSGLLHWHCGNLTIAPVPAKQPWWIWINTSCEFIMNDCITTTKQSTTKQCAYFLGYTVCGRSHKSMSCCPGVRPGNLQGIFHYVSSALLATGFVNVEYKDHFVYVPSQWEIVWIYIQIDPWEQCSYYGSSGSDSQQHVKFQCHEMTRKSKYCSIPWVCSGILSRIAQC